MHGLYDGHVFCFPGRHQKKHQEEQEIDERNEKQRYQDERQPGGAQPPDGQQDAVRDERK
jgi:hypothetical protein